MTQLVLCLEDIKNHLPHRPPMLMLDRVISYDDVSIHAEKYVAANAFYFQGHFPGNPMMPGVMIVEAIAQAGALIAALGGGFNREESLLAFAGIDSAKFRKPVYPNETLSVFVKIVKQRRSLYKFEGYAAVGDSVVTKLNFSATQVPKLP